MNAYAEKAAGHRSQMVRWLLGQDWFIEWAGKSIPANPVDAVSATELYRRYVEFSEEKGMSPISQSIFGQAIVLMGFTRWQRGSGNAYYGEPSA